MDFTKEYNLIKEEIISLRRQIHSEPELSFEEYKTSGAICRFLDMHNIPYKSNIASTGVCAIIGKGNDRVLLIRADIDALPTEEKTNLEFASKNKGVMHACGHDIHIASALACATILKKHEDKLKGTVKIVFQPGEETTGGAEPMISEGIMENPDVTQAICGHVTPNYEVGTIAVKPGAIMASPDDFMIEFVGKSTHGAEPENGISPIIPGCEFVSSLKDIENDLTSGANVLSICTIKADGSINTIPDNLKILGTYRSFDDKMRHTACDTLKALSEEICKKYGTKLNYKYNFLYPPVINDEKMTEDFVSATKEVCKNIVILDKPFMTGDDFAYFAKCVPSVYFWFGGKADKDCTLHSSQFIVSEDAIFECAKVYLNYALNYLR